MTFGLFAVSLQAHFSVCVCVFVWCCSLFTKFTSYVYALVALRAGIATPTPTSTPKSTRSHRRDCWTTDSVSIASLCSFVPGHETLCSCIYICMHVCVSLCLCVCISICICKLVHLALLCIAYFIALCWRFPLCFCIWFKIQREILYSNASI